MKIYRIALTQYCDVSGEGAKRYGGRWNLPGYPALYGSGSVAAGLLERLTIDPELFSSDRHLQYSVMEFACDDTLIYTPTPDKLPDGWDTIPATGASQSFGTSLLQKDVLCFQVPSVVDASSYNFIINPQAVGFAQIKLQVSPLTLDQRIVR